MSLFDTYPDAPGFQARDTSKAAADAVAPHAKSLRARVYDAIREKPDTPEGVAKRLRVDVMSVRPRCSELAERELIEDSGARGPSRGGKRAIVWRVPA